MTEFDEILAFSRKQEKERMKRQLQDTIRDEFVVNEEISRQLDNGTFRFSGERILARRQEEFSAKVHIRESALYFHRHEFIEALYMYRGSCNQYIGSLHNCIRLEEGDFFVLNQNVVHGLLQTKEDAILIKMILPVDWVSYAGIEPLDHESPLFDFLVEAKSPVNEMYHYLHFKNCGAEIKRLMELLMIDYYEENKYRKEFVRCHLRLLMFRLDEDDKKIVCESVSHRLTQSSLDGGRIIQYVYEHSEDITLEALAGEFGFNQSYLSRMIKETCKMNFQDLVTESRLEKAAILLSASTIPVEEIAQRVGYRNAAPVYQGIKRKFDMTPSEYREHYRKSW